MSAKTYLLRAAIFSLLICLIVLGLNFTVDPYGITGVRRMPHLNQYKVDINEHTGLMKKYQPLFRQHNALIVGNSRVELGISPSHHCFSDNGMDVYNLGIPGTDVPTQLAYALNVVYEQPIKTVFLSLDFTDFISPLPESHHVEASILRQPTGEFRLTALGESNSDYPRIYFLDHLKALFSLDALVASSRTIVLQDIASADRDDSGFNPARDFEEAVRIEGPRALFDQKMLDLQRKYSTVWYLRDTDARLNPAFEDLDMFLAITAARGIRVYLFTNPFHEKFWEMLQGEGHMPLYEDWTRSIENLVKRHEGGSVVFWNFSEDSFYIHETVPAERVKSGPLQWFWEPAHYRRQLGDLMVNAMLSDRCDTEVTFGRRVF
jgi:hypothetical protein